MLTGYYNNNNTYGYNTWYVGVTDMEEEGTWRWIDGSPVDVTIIQRALLNNRDNNYNETDPRYTNADCGTFAKDGRLKDDNCGYENRYICEMNW